MTFFGSNQTQAVLARAGNAGQIDQKPSTGASRVYMGSDFHTPTSSTYYGSTTNAQTAESNLKSAAMWDVDKAKLYFDYMDPQHKAITQAYTNVQAGYNVKAQWTVQSKYEDAITKAQQMSNLTGEPVSVFDIMRGSIERNGGAIGSSGGGGGYGGGGGGGGGGPSTTTQVSLTNASDAEMLVDQALKQYLGREADPGERDRFFALLNKRQQKNPTVTTTTPTGAGADVVSRGGLNPQEAAKEFALSQKDAAEYMANTQYMDWLVAKMSADPTEGIASGL